MSADRNARGRWFTTFEHTEAEIKAYARERGWKLWKTWDKGTGERAFYGGLELPKRIAQFVRTKRMEAHEVEL